MASYLPAREPEFQVWAKNFNSLISDTPTVYGLTTGQATALDTLFINFSSAYALATTPSTRTTPTIGAKDEAKKELIDGVGGIRELVRIIQATPSVTVQQKLDLGLKVRDVVPTPVPPPSDPPELDIVSVVGRTVKIRLHNDRTLDRKKPNGVKGAAVFTYVGVTPPDDMDSWKFEGNTTLTVIDIDFAPDVPAGSQVWLTAFWSNAKFQSGPPCQPVSTILAGGLAAAA